MLFCLFVKKSLSIRKQNQPARNNPCRLKFYLLNLNFLPNINEISVLDTIILSKLRNSGLVALCDARERVSTLYSISYCLLCGACSRLASRSDSLLLKAVQPCRLDLRRIVHIADVHINIAADTADSASGAVLPHTICSAVVAA